MKTLVIDNHDSYTYLLAQYLWKANGEKPLVVPNDALSIEKIRGLDFHNIVISPGPGHPAHPGDFGVCMDVLKAFPDRPILGVCLGHQGLGVYAGAKVRRAPRVMHGKTSAIVTDGSSLFRGLPRRFTAMRYHSLIVDSKTVPEGVKVTARTDPGGLVMGLQFKDRPWYGVQFHPESIGTSQGQKIIDNFKEITERWYGRPLPPVRSTGRSGMPRRVKPKAAGFFYERIPWQDAETVFETIYAGEPYGFWLDSNKPGENGRFSFLGASNLALESGRSKFLIKKVDPRTKAVSVQKRLAGDPFEFFREFLSRRRVEGGNLPFEFRGGLVGYLGYELKEFLGFGSPRPLDVSQGALPDGLMMAVDRFIAYDHATRRCYACAVGGSPGQARAWIKGLEKRIRESRGASHWRGGIATPSAEPLRVRKAVFRSRYIGQVKSLLRKIRDGETYEACLTNEFFVPGKFEDPLGLYGLLRRTNPAPYSAFLRFPEASILSSSPESFLNLSCGGRVRSEPIKGTRPVGKTRAETAAFARELAASGKDRSELFMITDLIRNDLSKVCREGSVRVEDLIQVKEYATVLQMSSVITGRLEEGLGAVDLVRAAFPGGSITGAPKRRTIEILDRLEKRPRGVYTGSIGYFSYNGAMDLSIAIRTMVAAGDGVRFGSGGAVVHESDPEKEYREIGVKAGALLKAVFLEKGADFRYDSMNQS